jgi:hypothetical protein
MSRRHTSWLAEQNRIPPWFCRLVARKGNTNANKPMTKREIARVSGLAESTIQQLSHMRNWNRVTMLTVQRFSLGCGVDLRHPWPHILFFRKRACIYMKRATKQQRAMYDAFLAEHANRKG